MMWLPDGRQSLMICLAVSTQYRRVTDGQTGEQTDRHLAAMHSPRYEYASNGENNDRIARRQSRHVAIGPPSYTITFTNNDLYAKQRFLLRQKLSDFYRAAVFDRKNLSDLHFAD